MIKVINRAAKSRRKAVSAEEMAHEAATRRADTARAIEERTIAAMAAATTKHLEAISGGQVDVDVVRSRVEDADGILRILASGTPIDVKLRRARSGWRVAQVQTAPVFGTLRFYNGTPTPTRPLVDFGDLVDWEAEWSAALDMSTRMVDWASRRIHAAAKVHFGSAEVDFDDDAAAKVITEPAVAIIDGNPVTVELQWNSTTWMVRFNGADLDPVHVGDFGRGAMPSDVFEWESMQLSRTVR